MKKIILCLVLLLAFVDANAITITVNDNIVDNTFMTNGTTLNGVFDINSVLTPADQYNQPYDIQNGSFSFTFQDDGDLTYTNFLITDWVFSSNNQLYTRYHYKYFYDEPEGINVNIQGQDSFDETDWFSQNFLHYTSVFFDSYYHYTYQVDVKTGYSGEITITHTLGSDLLYSLADDGMLNFSLQAVGDLYYKTGSLTVDVNPNPQTPDLNAMPEPGTMLLFGVGLLSIAGASRRRSK